MPRGRGIPGAGGRVLAHRTFLQKDLAAPVEDKDMYRAMLEPKAMHLAARLLANDFILVVDDVKNLTGVLSLIHSFLSTLPG